MKLYEMGQSICIRNFMQFIRGEVYETQQDWSGDYIYLKKYKVYEELPRITKKDYDHYFKPLEKGITLPKILTNSRMKFLKKFQSTKIVKVNYRFDLESKYLSEIQKYVFIPIYLMEDNDIILQFSDGIHYVLDSLEELSKMRNYIDLEAEIEKAKVYFEELERLYNGINISAKKAGVANLLNQHHENMENLISLLKEFNK